MMNKIHESAEKAIRALKISPKRPVSPAVPEGILFGLGNPLLDIQAPVDPQFLVKYHVKSNSAILANEAHDQLYNELCKKQDVQYIAGGSAQNSLRVAQWILQVPHATTFMGAVGTDNYAEILEGRATSDGVHAVYQKVPDFPTGTCAALITNSNRSLVAKLAAACHFSKEHLQKRENWGLVEKARFIYQEGYFLVTSEEAVMMVAKHAAATKKHFMINLSADYIAPYFAKNNNLLGYVDIVFGNNTEFEELAKVLKFPGEVVKNVGEIGRRICALPKINGDRSRTVVITQGSSPVIVVDSEGAREYPVTPLDVDAIKDTNGAGDAFVGGFLAQLVQGKEVKECVKCGIWAATEVIKSSGCTFPKEKRYPE